MAPPVKGPKNAPIPQKTPYAAIAVESSDPLNQFPAKIIEMVLGNRKNLDYTFKKYEKLGEITKLIPFWKNDKKNNDDKINFILLNKIGKTTIPNKNKISLSELKRKIKLFNQY